MKAIQEKREGAYVVGGEQAGQPEYLPLEVRRCEQGALWSAWKPSWKEWLQILLGEPIRVGILAQRQPPIMVVVEPRPTKSDSTSGEG